MREHPRSPSPACEVRRDDVLAGEGAAGGPCCRPVADEAGQTGGRGGASCTGEYRPVGGQGSGPPESAPDPRAFQPSESAGPFEPADPEGLSGGSELDDSSELSDLTSRDLQQSALPRRRGRELSPLQRALGLLVRREHSRKELSRKLIARGIASEDAESAVSRLTEAGWQDDTRFAESLVRNRVSGGYGPLHIRAELATHGLGREAVAAALASFEGDWAAIARDLVRRRYGQDVAQDLRLQRKAAQLLTRRGFDSACVRSATRFDPDE